jgi:putative sugar O-methyltransferase
MTLFWNKYSSGRNFNINNFRNSKKNNIFANWSPYQRGLVYYNFLINYYVNQNKLAFIKFKKNINNLNIGNPPHLFLNKKYHITYDDCLSFEEIFFLKKNFKTKKKLNIIEIGPGYGRTVECILRNYNINQYFCVDYKDVLTLTKKYLKKVLNKNLYNKIIFCEFKNFNFKKNFFMKTYNVKNFDLLINSDSFHEIEVNIVKKYLNFFSPICNYFFIKNAIAKYKPQDLIDHLSKNNIPNYNQKLGLCSETINIFDIKKIKIQSRAYLRRYNPFKDKKKTKVYSMLSEIYPSCMLALFVNKNK